MNFHYSSGETVMDGDRVRKQGGLGVVESIIRPKTREAVEYYCPDGGVLVRECLEEPRNRVVLTPTDGEQWGGLVLVSRQRD